MNIIKLEKRSKVKKTNNSYDITCKSNTNKKIIGSYNQTNNKLILDL
jgi:hypothetical protein